MFASAREIVHGARLSDLDHQRFGNGDGDLQGYDAETDEEYHQEKLRLLREKYDAAQEPDDGGHRFFRDHGSGVADSISGKGYDWTEPVHIHVALRDKKTPLSVADGHHRLAVMYHTAPDEPIPLMVSEARDNPQHGGLENLTGYGVKQQATTAARIGAYRRMGQGK